MGKTKNKKRETQMQKNMGLVHKDAKKTALKRNMFSFYCTCSPFIVHVLLLFYIFQVSVFLELAKNWMT